MLWLTGLQLCVCAVFSGGRAVAAAAMRVVDERCGVHRGGEGSEHGECGGAERQPHWTDCAVIDRHSGEHVWRLGPLLQQPHVSDAVIRLPVA